MNENDELENLVPELEVSDETEDKPSRKEAAKAFFRALNAGKSPEVSTSSCSNCNQLVDQITQLEQKVVEAESLYKRMAADFENYRRRIDKEREELLSIGVQKAVEALLPALDDIERAKCSLDSSMPSEKLLESLELVHNRISQCLEQVGVKTMSAIGDTFDPKYHEPVQQIATTDFPDGSVMQELRRGYMLNDKVVRPVLVNVAHNTSKPVKGSKHKEDVEKSDSEA